MWFILIIGHFAAITFRPGICHGYCWSFSSGVGGGWWKITCDGSQTVEFLPRTHFFRANPLFRISAINSEGCIDGPVSTNHSFKVPLMSGQIHHCLHSGEYRDGFVNRKTHQINSLLFWLSKSYNIILPKQQLGESEYVIIAFFSWHRRGSITALHHQHHAQDSPTVNTLLYYSTS